ncbi:MAG: helix-turn-helix transcriptional regulator [Desulfosalsimonadaceae bacterium]|nr:helix-turn-helix transcriptional regulator [Desulfosalsimonadaceae bacterium]
MKTYTDYQTIDYNGKPAFVLIPWEEFKRVQNLLEADKACATGIPQEVVEAHVLNSVPMIRAWREYMGITQGELAARMDVSQAAIAKLERPLAKPRAATLRKIANALGISLAQLDV